MTKKERDAIWIALEKVRGKEAADKLLRVTKEQYELGNRGKWGEWN